MNPHDIDNDILRLKSLNIKFVNLINNVDIISDPEVPIGVVIAVADQKPLDTCFALAEIPQTPKELKTYLHIGNSGITFSVCDSGKGPEIKIQSSAFGNIQNTSLIYTNKESLKKIGEMFLEASKQEYSKEYVNLAQNISSEKYEKDEKPKPGPFVGEFG